MEGVKAIAVIFIALAGCATTAAGTKIAVTKDTQRNFNGFSISPPQGSGWFAIRLKDDWVAFEKRATSLKHRVIAGVDRYPAKQAFNTPEEYLAYVRNTYFQASPKYYEVVSKEADLNPRYGEYCVRYQYKYKDTAMKRPRDVPYVVHEGQCYVCLHPEAREYEFNICWSEEYAPGQEDAEIRAEKPDFIEHFAFSRFVAETRIHVLSNVPSTFFTIFAEADGKQVGSFSECGKTSDVALSPGQHTLRVFYGGPGRANVFNKPEIKFQTVEGRSNYFVILQRDWAGTLMYNMSIREVTEEEWTQKAGLGAGAAACKGYH
ncbi:MAG TPA: hypothetical protein VI078_09890 [bacterium]